MASQLKIKRIYIGKGQVKCFLGWGLKVTYNSDIFEKLRPPMRFQMYKFEFQTFLFVFFIPPTLFGTLSQIFPFLNYDASHMKINSLLILSLLL